MRKKKKASRKTTKNITSPYDRISFINQLLKKILMVSSDAIIITDLTGNIIFVSDKAVEINGAKSSDELTGKNAFEFIVPEERQRAVEDVKKTFEQGFMAGLEYVLYKKDNKKFSAKMNITLIKDKKNNPVAFLGTIRDVTDLKRKDEHLKQSEKKFQAIFNLINDSIFLCNIQENMIPGKFTEANEIAYKKLGYTKEEFLALSPFDINSQDDMEKIHLKWERFLKEHETEFQTDIITKTGKKIPHEIKLVMTDIEGRKQILGIARDVSERIKAMDDIKTSESNYKSIFNGISDSIVIIDQESRKIIDMNEAAIKSFGITRDSVANFKLDNFGTMEQPYSSAEVYKWVEKAIKIGPQVFEWKRIDKNGDVSWVEVFLQKAIINNKNCLLAISRNINRRKKAEQDLLNSYITLKKIVDGIIQTMEKLVEKKDKYTVGHQRRTAELASNIARKLGLEDNTINGIYTAALIHDIGKIFVSGSILNKISSLTNDEYKIVKTHANAGYEILKSIDFPWPVALMIKQHHERMDGSGYPDGLKGDEILLESRIISVADVVEAITFERPYRVGFGIDRALEEIQKNKGKLYDEKIVDVCVGLFKDDKYEFAKK